MQAEPTTHESHADGYDVMQEVRRREERWRRRRRALMRVVLLMAGTAGIAWGIYVATAGDLPRTLGGAGAGGLLLVALAIYVSHRKTMRALRRPLVPNPPVATTPWTPAPAPALSPAPPPPDPPPEEQQGTVERRPRRRRQRPVKSRSPHAVSIATTALIAAVAIALVASVLSMFLASRRSGTTVGTTHAAATADPGPAGFAEQVIGAWLRAGEDHLAELQPLMGRPVDLAGVPSGSFDATRINAISTTPLGANYWSVLLAADRVQRISKPGGSQPRWEPDGTHYYRVGISGGKGRYLATGLPGEVARPMPPDAPALAVTAQAAADLSDPRTDTLERFFDAFLAGTGELSRYVVPGIPARPVDETNRYADSQLRNVGFDDPQARTRVTADVTVAATNKAGNLQVLAYSLTLVNRDGRWYVKALDGAAALAP